MIKIEIKGSEIGTEADFHSQVASLLHFPNYYGHNLDAFWDCYTDFLISYPDEKICFYWLNHEESRNNLGAKFFNLVVSLLEDGKREWKPDLDIKLC